MKKNIYFILILITGFNCFLFAQEIKIVYPVKNQNLCRNEPVIIKWTGSATEYKFEIKTDDAAEFMPLKNYQIKDNSFIWIADNPEYLDKPLKFRISDKNNPAYFDEISGITVYEETKILSQTKSSSYCEGENIILTIEAEGKDLKYQWYKDNELIDNEIQSLLMIDNAGFENSGSYKCVLSSPYSCKNIESEPIAVYVATPTKFISRKYTVQWKYRATAKMGGELHINTLHDLDNIYFDWYKDTIVYTILSNYPFKLRIDTVMIKLNESKKYFGSNSQQLQVRNLVWSDRTTYHCIANGLCGTDTILYEIGDKPFSKIIKKTEDFYGCEGQDVTLEIEVIQPTPTPLTYQWYRTGKKIINESKKFVGTRTPKLIIKNVNTNEDSHYYYCEVTEVKTGLTQNSDFFVIIPEMPPQIFSQPSFYIISDRSNKYYGQTYVNVVVKNVTPCTYSWYRNDSLVRKSGNSDYWVEYPPDPPRPAVLSDTGWYRCLITNDCGSVWSDSVHVTWGYDEVYGCKGDNVAVKVKNLGNNYEYYWIKDKMKVHESDRIKNPETTSLIINNLQLEDEGFYIAMAVDNSTNEEIFLGKIYVETHYAPYITREFPSEIKNDGNYIKTVNIVLKASQPKFYMQLFIDGKPETELMEYIIEDMYNTVHSFYIGGFNTNLKPGKYQYYFKNDCGEVWSKEMNVINTFYKPGGIIKREDNNDGSSADNNNLSGIYDNDYTGILLVYPNPASEYIIINLNNEDFLSENESLSPYINVCITNIFGIEVYKEQINLTSENQRINISQLPAGLYYIKFGNAVSKFIKM